MVQEGRPRGLSAKVVRELVGDTVRHPRTASTGHRGANS
jgi:hypothetical protein